MIAVEDIGRYAAHAFVHADEMNRREIDLAGDAVTLPQAAAIIGEAVGRKLEYVRIPIVDVRKSSEDFAIMLEWFERVGYSADIAGLQRKYGIKPTTLREWATTNLRR
jgi:uncharacterized protein YbjT (DUF2867 family)